MEGDNDGNGWKFGLSFICCGIVFVMGMGVFSLVYHAQYKGKQGSLLSEVVKKTPERAEKIWRPLGLLNTDSPSTPLSTDPLTKFLGL